MSAVIPELRNFPIHKTCNLQALKMQPMFLIKASHNGEIGEDHQQTMLKRYLISAPNEYLARHYFILNVLNSVEDLSRFSQQELANIFQILNHRFIRNENHISLASRTSGYKTFSTENIFVKSVKEVYFSNCYGYLSHNKIIDANFNLIEFKQHLDYQQSNQYNSQNSQDNKTQINVYMGDTHNTQKHETGFANLASSSLSTQSKSTESSQPVEKEAFADLFAQSGSTSNDDENRWNREEYNKSSGPQFGRRDFPKSFDHNRHSGTQPNHYLRKTHNHHPDSAQQHSNNWLNTSSQPTQVTLHKPFKSLMNKTNK